MPIIIDNTNYINNDYDRRSAESTRGESVREGVLRTSGGGGSLTAGSTITGEIVEKEGEQVTINLGGGRTVSAKLQGNADIEVGMKLSFEVAKGSGGQIALRPLYSNLANNNAAVSALRAAGLPVNDTTLSMTDKMMSESMPVNRNALAEMFRNVSAHQNASPESIVQMTKLNMPLTESNVIQFDNYRNFEHQITNDLQNVTDGIGELFKEALDGAYKADGAGTQLFGNLAATDVINEVLDLIDTDRLDTIMPEQSDIEAAKTMTEARIQSPVADQLETALAPETAVAPSDNEALSLRDTVDEFINGIREMFSSDEAEAEFVTNSNLSLTSSEQMTLSNQLQNVLILAGQSADIHEPLNPSEIITAVKQLLEEYPPDDVRVVETELPAYSEEDGESASQEALNNAAQSEIDALKSDTGTGAATAAQGNENAAATVENPATAAEAGEAATRSVRQKIHEGLKEMLSSEGFSKLLKDSVKAQMSIKPEQVAEKGKIDELYERIQKTSAKINDLMESIGRVDSAAARSSAALGDNVNFMNQLNEFVNYVQLPLKMAGEDANGELYVYTNRKNLANNDGNYSALLHLDMDHLGPMDIYVIMRDHTKVSTNFYLESEELLDFIESHIDELTKRLTDKGYNTSTKVTQREAGAPIGPITDEFTKEDAKADNPVVVSKMRFDVRA